MRKLIASLALAAAPAWAVVDIAPQEVGAHPGVSGNISASYSSDTGNTEKDESEFSMIGYYQPAFESAVDCYASFNAELTLHVAYDLYLSFTYELDHDSRPPEGIEKDDGKIKTSLVWKFQSESR
jgi:putative salt-induced outer membrane protein YdiY